MYLGCLTLLSLTTSVRQRPVYLALTGISMYTFSYCMTGRGHSINWPVKPSMHSFTE